MKKEDYQNFYNSYWAKGKSDNKHRYGIFLSWIEPGSRVLDIGCGDGYLAELITKNKNCNLTCLDISDVALQRAKARNLKVVQASMEDVLPFDDNSFDYVIATEALEHIAKTEEVLLEMVRVSKKHLLVSIPNIAFWKYRWTLLRGRFPKQWVVHPIEHLRYWSVDDFKKMLKDLNFGIEETKAGSGRRYVRDLWPNLFAKQVCFKLSKK